jgi:hypothetical protein
MSNADLIAEARAARGGRFYGPISDDPSVLDLIARLADALESAERAVAFERLRQVDEALEASEAQPALLVADSREALADALILSGVVSLAADRIESGESA